MSGGVIHNLDDGVLEIVIDNPPVNSLGASVRQGLWQALDRAEQNGDVRAVVIRGAGLHFSGGADIKEFGQPLAEPWIPELVNRIEASRKPIVAAIRGVCYGGGLEVALACHARIAAPSAMLALPEVKLGLIPGAGGTQRLPRLIPVREAFAMIIGGEPVSAIRALEIGLVDRIVEENDFVAQASAFARDLQRPTPSRDRPVIGGHADIENLVAEKLVKLAGRDAPAACLTAIRAAIDLPFAAGCVKERELFWGLLNGAQSRAMRHVYFAERAAAKVDGLDAAPRELKTIGIIGAGTMGTGIAMTFLSAGLPVVLVEASQEPLNRAVATIRRTYEASAKKGRIPLHQVEEAMSLLAPRLDFAALADCDLVIEAVFELMEIKKDVFRRLDAFAKPGAILASNTSYLDIDLIAAETRRPGDVLGLHFFSPAHVMRLLEVVRGAKTTPDVLATAMRMAKQIRKVAVVSGVCHGFIGNRMLAARQGQADALLLEGASPEQIDQVHVDFGMPMGPYQMFDLAGNDIGWSRDASHVESIRDALCVVGRFGQKTRAGYYDYDDSRKPTSSPVTVEIIEEFRVKAGTAPRKIGDDEILVRTLYTMINEGAKILEEKIAQRASDIDVVWVAGYGWPAVKGGPMFWADELGAAEVVSKLEAYRNSLPSDFRISRLLRDLASSGGRFSASS